MPVPPYYDWIAHHAHRRPKQLAINDLQTHRTYSYADLHRRTDRLTGWLATMESLPSGYNKDLQEDKEAVFDAEDTFAGSVASTATVVAWLTVHPTRPGGAAGGFLLATDAADYLVGRGVPFRKAHEIVAGMVRTLLQQGRSFEGLTAEEWRSFDTHFEPDVIEKVTARRSVEARKTPQSTAPAAVAAALQEARAWVAQQRTEPAA